MSPKSRNRGRMLTPEGLGRLQQAIHAWELENEIRCTQEKLRELTIAEKPPNGLDPGTISKILEADKGVDPKSIRCLFKTLGLELDEADLVTSSRSQLQVDPNFVGREGAIADLTALVNRDVRVIVIQARGGVGKTTLARKYLQQEFGSFLEFPIAKETKDIASIESLIEEKLRQLGEEPGREFFVSLDRLKRKLQGERIGILIDNLEPALDSAGKFIEPHRRYVELLRVLADPSVQSVTLITTRERLRESSITVENYILRSLDLTAWEQFFQSRNLSTDTLDFAVLHNAYGGNAKAMDIIRSAILEDYAGDIAAYWQANQHDLFIERDLEDLVTQQFDRLQQIDADAYNLLCRMGCYRYQDVPTVPIEGLLCLLWDVPENRQRRVVKSLQDRSLVEFANGEYWLHPVIRAEAIEHLRTRKDWERTNLTAADYWTEIIETVETIRDALRAFEAYYHFFEIGAYEKAGTVITKERPNNRFRKMHSLGGVLVRFGMWQLMVFAITRIEINMQSGYCLSNLYRILTNAYLFTGYIHLAIKFSQRSGDIANFHIASTQEVHRSQELISRFETLLWISLTNVGLCKILLGEIEEAEDIYKKVITDEEVFIFSEKYRKRSVYEWSVLAFLCSCRNAEQEALAFAEKAYYFLSISSLIEFDIWTLGYGSFFLGMAYKNLKNFEKSQELYNKAISYAEETMYFSQIKGNALTGLAGLYREENLETAFSYHLKAIEILGEVGAKCDLAEAKYQLGLTYQVVGDTEKSRLEFQEAIELFNEIEAPKQVERVRRSLQNLNSDYSLEIDRGTNHETN